MTMTDKQKNFLVSLLVDVAGWSKNTLTLPDGITKKQASEAISLLVEARDLIDTRFGTNEALVRYPALYHKAEEVIGLSNPKN